MKFIFQFIKFGVVGLTNTAIHYVIYLVCTLLGVNYIVANFLAFTISVINSFYWNNKYVFNDADTKSRNALLVFFKTYISYGLTGLLLSSVLLYIEIDKIGINSAVAPLINLIITIPLNFVINKYWAYRAK